MPPPHASNSRTVRRRLTDQDRADWDTYISAWRHQTERHPVAPPAAPAAPMLPVPPPQRVAPAVRAKLDVGRAPAGLDAAAWKRLTAGGMAVTRRLDLHGMTVQQAFERFVAVMHAAAADGTRCLEVITGRGAGEGGGALRRELPLWLNRPDLRPFILAAAHPHRRNDGAVLVLLRRPRT